MDSKTEEPKTNTPKTCTCGGEGSHYLWCVEADPLTILEWRRLEKISGENS